MRLTSCVLLSLLCATSVAAQTPAPKPPARRAASPTVTTTALSISVTDGKGAPIADAAVRVSGPVDREGATDSNGALRLEGLRTGAYRLRFSREGFITLERDLTVPAGQRAMDQRVMLSVDERPPKPMETKPA